MGRTTENPQDVLRAADRRRIEGALKRRGKAEADLYAAVREASERGASLREIAAVAGVSHQAVAKWLAKHE